MKKKRLMAAGLSAAMVLSMTACGGKEAPAETKKEETKTEYARWSSSYQHRYGP